ncbi:DUF3311 domain-containing protein [Acidiferrobacter sp.]|uniref:DUF3311 domain-containing protein n=1 Tax=Acidiferrobacter sp. TaxID=1872107 RepID=UPI0026145C4B|nr:DUF3311 domain-containing protein [Acidiferrobacter sp.]
MSTSASRWAYLLLVIPFLGTLWVPLYNRVQPTVWGFPFFYWYQLAWVPVSVVLTGIVYRLGRGAQNSDEAGS